MSRRALLASTGSTLVLLLGAGSARAGLLGPQTFLGVLIVR